MKFTWSLREELATASQKWHIVVLYILVGALLGAGASWILPGPYEAMTDFYVGLDIYRSLRDFNIPIRPEGVNDYKNWQMEDLKLVIRSETVMEETLKLLRQEDSHWNNVKSSELALILNVYWRNAGRWRLAAKDQQNNYARQAVRAWEKAALKEVKSGVEQSQLVLVLDARIQALAAKLADLSARKAQIENTQTSVNDWLLRAGSLPEDDMIPEKLFLEILAILQAAQLSDSDQTISSPGNNVPPPVLSDIASVKQWTYQFKNRLQTETESLNAQTNQLEEDMTRLKEQYASASKNSWGLSANLIVRSFTDEPPLVRQLRPVGQMILIGAVIGLLLWIVQWLGVISLAKPPGDLNQP